MNFVLDIILLAILVLSVVIGIRKGFIRMTVSVVGTILAVVLAFALSAGSAKLIYNICFEERISTAVDNVVQEEIGDTADETIDRLFSQDKFIMKIAKTCGLTPEYTKSKVPDGNIISVSNGITNNVIKPAFISFLRIISFIVLLILLLFVSGVLSKIIGKTLKHTPLNGINRFFGGVMGVIMGMAFIIVACSFLNSLLNIMPDGFIGITSDSRDNSIIYGFITKTLNIYIG